MSSTFVPFHQPPTRKSKRVGSTTAEMEPSWLQHLNIIVSPDGSPTNGPELPALRTEESLSFPVASDELQKQLEAWTSVQFHSEQPIQGGEGSFFDAKVQENKSKIYENGFSNYFTAAGGASVDPLLFAPFAQASPLFASDGSNLLIHPNVIAPPGADQAALATPASVTEESTPPSSKPSPKTTSKARTGSKRGRKPLLPPNLDPDDPDAQAQQRAIEEDKRRRNTAASARFRVKKKEREQAMASNVQVLHDRVQELEKELDNLKLENDWLRKLIFEKGKGGMLEERDAAEA